MPRPPDRTDRNQGARRLTLAALLAAAAAVSGCTAMIHHAVVTRYPTYGQTTQAWSPIPAGQGRVVVYWPRLGAFGFNPVPFSGPGGFGMRALHINDLPPTSIGDQTFVFADLPAGRHTVKVIKQGAFGSTSSTSVELDVPSGSTAYVELRSSHTTEEAPTVVDERRAREALVAIHHNYELPLPFHAQPPRAKRAF